MQRKDLNAKSPLRVLERSIHGGLGRGNLGVIMARKGVGKTAFLVGVALDDLMRERKVLHVTIDGDVDRVRAFYDELFADLAHEQQLEDVWKVRLEIERNRRIHCYAGHAFGPEKLRGTLEFMRQHTDFAPSAIILDGFDFEHTTEDGLRELRAIAREADAEMWLSAITHRESARDARGIAEPVASLAFAVDVVLSMAHDGQAVHVRLHKDHDSPAVPELKLALDPKTMLLVGEG